MERVRNAQEVKEQHMIGEESVVIVKKRYSQKQQQSADCKRKFGRTVEQNGNWIVLVARGREQWILWELQSLHLLFEGSELSFQSDTKFS